MPLVKQVRLIKVVLGAGPQNFHARLEYTGAVTDAATKSTDNLTFTLGDGALFCQVQLGICQFNFSKICRSTGDIIKVSLLDTRHQLADRVLKATQIQCAARSLNALRHQTTDGRNHTGAVKDAEVFTALSKILRDAGRGAINTTGSFSALAKIRLSFCCSFAALLGICRSFCFGTFLIFY